MAKHKGYGFGRLVENVPTLVLVVLALILSLLLYFTK